MHDPQLALARLISVEEIRDLIFEYTNLLDAGNLEGMAELFAHSAFGNADRVGRLSGELSFGAASVLQQYRDFTRIHADLGTPRTKHFTTNVRVKVAADNNRATATSYVMVVQETPRLPLQVILTSRNFDQFERHGDVWRFSQRLISVDQIGDLSEHALRPL